jgi:hypothetical protein
MHQSLPGVSLDTLIAASTLLGHELEDRTSISQAQDLQLTEQLAAQSARPLRDSSQRELFCVAPLDILVSDHDGRKRFHLLELNGTGIGGVTNMPAAAIESVLDSLAENVETFDNPHGLVLLAVSGKESETSPRMNRLMHEKLLFVEAMRSGLRYRFGECDVANLGQLAARASQPRLGTPTVVIGYMKDLMQALTLDDEGRLWMHNRPVMGAVNDRFCRNVLQRFHEQVDLTKFQALNRCFAAGSDKGLAYGLMNEFVQEHPHSALPHEVLFSHAHSRLGLIQTVLDWLERGRNVVIKPHGTGLGHGIEFFFDPQEPLENIIDRIDGSLQQTEEYYGMAGGALPYTVCEYVDACRVEDPQHPLAGHKYELRVVVHREGNALRAMPSIAKVARERMGEGVTDRRALINNITASGDTIKVSGTDYMLPLCNERTLELLGLTRDDLRDVCAIATGYVGHVLNQTQDAPQIFGLPTARAASAPAVEAVSPSENKLRLVA